MSASPVICPSCLRKRLSWHDTNPQNQTDMGNGKPYLMCEDQEGCGLIVSVLKVEKLRAIYRKLK